MPPVLNVPTLLSSSGWISRLGSNFPTPLFVYDANGSLSGTAGAAYLSGVYYGGFSQVPGATVTGGAGFLTNTDLAGNVTGPYAANTLGETDAGAGIWEARTNLVFPSDVLTTQIRTVAASAHTLSFYGTGTITLSGVSTAGPLVGTGANDRVSLTFTPTAGSLTLTVSGDVRMANLELGSVPSPYIPTTSAAATRTAINASITGLSSILTPPFTLFVDGYLPAILGTNRWLLLASDGGASNYVALYRNSADKLYGRQSVGGVSTYVPDMGAFSAAGAAKAALRVEASGAVSGSLNGVYFAGSTISIPAGLSSLAIGKAPSSGELNGQIRRVVILPDMSGAALAALTA